MMKTSGLTLIELVIVLAVFSILSAVAALSFLNTDRRELQNASLALQADMRYAQRMAMLEGRRWRITFYKPNSYSLSAIEQNGLPKIMDQTELPAGMEFVEYSSSSMVYLPRGTGSEGFSVLIGNGKFKQKLTATISGGRVAVGDIISY